MTKIFKYLIISFLTMGCVSKEFDQNKLNDAALFHSAMQNLSDIIVYDIFSPPVASRVYLYPSIAAYELIAKDMPLKYKSLVGQVKGLTKIPEPEKDFENYNLNLTIIHAFNQIGRALIFSDVLMDKFEKRFKNKLISIGVPKKIKIASEKYAEKVAKHILNWAKDDLYNQTRTYSKYTILEEEVFWKPTPPDYMDGIEPHWNKIRTLVLDSANQFIPKAPLKFDLTKGSPFQKQLQEVYEIGNKMDPEKIEIAKFWDCNPYVTHHRGHAMFATKKITPGGHWIGITAIAGRTANSSFDEAVNAYANVSISLFDSFISCWDEKWRSILVRPETLINQHYDEEWLPLLQTPPFPEYTSGHSVISRAAAKALTKLYGNNFKFTDTTEVSYGLPSREYNSFIEAAEEAAISRLYGGIHYRMAIDEGVSQGEQIGNYISDNLETNIEIFKTSLNQN
ncbi:MAG: phosphatidic acid phosphatase [Flavobacteriaceae bacterium TMED200]|nr:phosphatidic acid phosphatase [Flavobacteriaceae bacterium]OUW66593.1 MAG: phosphatidic acid phosphatase [Flavobacteriaceae bacterium TMED200]